MQKITEIADQSYLQLTLVFIILVLLSNLGVLTLPIDYQLFIIVLPLLAIPALLLAKPFGLKGFKGTFPVLLIAFVFALLIRLIPHFQNSIPLGYDPGFYKYTMELYAESLPQIPEAGLAEWIKSMYPQGLFVLSDVMHIIAGTNGLQLINYALACLGAFLVFPVFIVTRNLFGSRAGLIAAVLYAISYTQFGVFYMCYFKNVLGLAFLLFSIYALEKKKYGLMAITFAGLGIFHRPEFLIFALILIPYFALHRRKGIVFGVLGAAILIAPFWIPRLETNWSTLSSVVDTAIINVQTGNAPGSGGTFLSFAYYREVSLVYFPFALMGGIYLAIKRNWNSVFFYFVINSLIVVFELFFYKRLIIPLDIAMVILAAVGIEYAILQRTKIPKVALIVFVVLIIVTAGVPAIDMGRESRPFISEEQLEAVEWIKENTEDEAFILATSYDAPWVLGWSERRVIAPGIFEWDRHGEEEWLEFLGTQDANVAGELLEDYLEAYHEPIYIYYSGDKPGNYFVLQKFDDERFQEVYSRDAVIHKYLGGV